MSVSFFFDSIFYGRAHLSVRRIVADRANIFLEIRNSFFRFPAVDIGGLCRYNKNRKTSCGVRNADAFTHIS